MDEEVKLTNQGAVQVSIDEAKVHLARLLEAVERGQEVVVA